jgi:hypothetical protein
MHPRNDYQNKYRARNIEKTRVWWRTYREAHKEVIKEQRRQYYKRNAERLKKVAAEYHAKNRDKCLRKMRARRNADMLGARLRDSGYRAKQRGYAPCTAGVAEVKASFTGHCQNHKCCREISGRGAHIDHDHATGRFRGWLCSQCNHALGLLHDSPEKIQGLKDYLTPSTHVT